MRKSCKISISYIFLLFVFIGSVFALPNLTERGYVNDFANVLNEETENYIYYQSKALDEKTKAQVVVATVETLEGKDINEYSIELARYWNIGNKDKNNGLLILLAPNERQIRVEIGYGLEGKINDGKAGGFIDDYAVPYLKSDDWNGGVKGLYTVILKEIYEEYGIEVPSDVDNLANIEYKRNGKDYLVEFAPLIEVAIITLIVIIVLFRNRRGGGNNGGHSSTWYDGGFGHGGFGSSGSNIGGFSGGGGSFGGGGASRGF